MKIAFIDHYDSFSYNLIALLKSIYPLAEIDIWNPENLKEVDFSKTHDFLCIGPGPGKPIHYPKTRICLDKSFQKLPILGVCLGMQFLAEKKSFQVKRALKPMHGKLSLLNHDSSFLFENIPNPFQVMRYHSLICDWPEAQIKSAEKEAMLVYSESEKYLVTQFHPESFASQAGKQLIQNFIRYVS